MPPILAVCVQSDEANACNGRRWQDGLTVGFVIERDIARNDREIERAAGFTDTFNGLDELAHYFRLFRVAEVQVVGRCQRFCASRRDVAPAFGHGLLATLEWIGFAIARGHVG